MRAVILAGGRGTRLHPYTKVLPKPLIPLEDTPILEILLTQLRDAGCDRVTLCVSYKADQIERYFGDGAWLGLDLDYSRCDIPLGTAGPLGLLPRPDQPCLVLNGDLLTTVDFAALYAAHGGSGATATLVLYRHAVNLSFGVAELADGGRALARLVEKPTFDFLVNAGIYVVDPVVWDAIPAGQFLDMPTLLQARLAAGERVGAYVFEGEWLDIGTTDQYHRADELFRRDPRRFLASQPSRRAAVGGR
jgi:NDP-sugar pyrophosphorylase family protein